MLLKWQNQLWIKCGYKEAELLGYNYMLRLKPLYRLILVISSMFFTLPLWSQEVEANNVLDGIITSIEISGLRRTRPHVAMYPLERFLGRQGSELDLNEVYAAVIGMGTLEPLAVELVEAEEGFILHVTVEEKWSIFPVPLIMAGSGETSFGLFLADANAFGLGNQIALGGMYSSTGWMAMAVYNHNSNRQGFPGWNTFFSFNHRGNEDSDRDNIIHRRYSVEQLRISLGLNYPLDEYLSGQTSFSFANIILRENPEDINPPENGAMHLGINPGLSLRHSSWDGIFLSQRSISLQYGYNHAIIGSSFHQAEIRGVYEQSLIPGFRFSIRSGAIWKSDADAATDPLFEEGPQRAQVDILPRKYSARHYAGFSAGLEKYLFNLSWGTLSVLASWQAVFSQGPISDFQFDHGPSGGIRFYLSRIALPAMGIGLAYNMNSGLIQFAFSLGMGF